MFDSSKTNQINSMISQIEGKIKNRTKSSFPMVSSFGEISSSNKNFYNQTIDPRIDPYKKENLSKSIYLKDNAIRDNEIKKIVEEEIDPYVFSLKSEIKNSSDNYLNQIGELKYLSNEINMIKGNYNENKKLVLIFQEDFEKKLNITNQKIVQGDEKCIQKLIELTKKLEENKNEINEFNSNLKKDNSKSIINELMTVINLKFSELNDSIENRINMKNNQDNDNVKNELELKFNREIGILKEIFIESTEDKSKKIKKEMQLYFENEFEKIKNLITSNENNKQSSEKISELEGRLSRFDQVEKDKLLKIENKLSEMDKDNSKIKPIIEEKIPLIEKENKEFKLKIEKYIEETTKKNMDQIRDIIITQSINEDRINNLKKIMDDKLEVQTTPEQTNSNEIYLKIENVNSNLKEELEEFNKKIKNYQLQMTEYNSRLLENEKKMTNLDSFLNTEFDSLKELIKEGEVNSNKNSDSLLLLIKNNDNSIKTNSEKLETLLNESKKIVEELSLLRNLKLEEKLDLINEDIKGLKFDNENIKSYINTHDFEKDINEINEKLADLAINNTKEDKNEEIESDDEKLEIINEEISKLKESLNDLDWKVTDLENKKETPKVDSEEKNVEIENLQKNNTQLIKDLEIYKTRLEKVEDKINIFEKPEDNTNDLKIINEIKHEVDEINSKLEILDTLNEKLNEKDEEISSLLDKNTHLSEKIDNIEKDLKSVRLEVQGLKENLDEPNKHENDNQALVIPDPLKLKVDLIENDLEAVKNLIEKRIEFESEFKINFENLSHKFDIHQHEDIKKELTEQIEEIKISEINLMREEISSNQGKTLLLAEDLSKLTLVFEKYRNEYQESSKPNDVELFNNKLNKLIEKQEEFENTLDRISENQNNFENKSNVLFDNLRINSEKTETYILLTNELNLKCQAFNQIENQILLLKDEFNQNKNLFEQKFLLIENEENDTKKQIKLLQIKIDEKVELESGFQKTIEGKMSEYDKKLILVNELSQIKDEILSKRQSDEIISINSKRDSIENKKPKYLENSIFLNTYQNYAFNFENNQSAVDITISTRNDINLKENISDHSDSIKFKMNQLYLTADPLYFQELKEIKLKGYAPKYYKLNKSQVNIIEVEFEEDCPANSKDQSLKKTEKTEKSEKNDLFVLDGNDSFIIDDDEVFNSHNASNFDDDNNDFLVKEEQSDKKNFLVSKEKKAEDFFK